MARAKVRELIEFIELHLELVVRRLYASVLRRQRERRDKKESSGISQGCRGVQAAREVLPYVRARVHRSRIAPLSSTAARVDGDEAHLRADFFEDFPQLAPTSRR